MPKYRIQLQEVNVGSVPSLIYEQSFDHLDVSSLVCHLNERERQANRPCEAAPDPKPQYVRITNGARQGTWYEDQEGMRFPVLGPCANPDLLNVWVGEDVKPIRRTDCEVIQ